MADTKKVALHRNTADAGTGFTKSKSAVNRINEFLVKIRQKVRKDLDSILKSVRGEA